MVSLSLDSLLPHADDRGSNATRVRHPTIIIVASTPRNSYPSIVNYVEKLILSQSLVLMKIYMIIITPLHSYHVTSNDCQLLMFLLTAISLCDYELIVLAMSTFIICMLSSY